MTSPLDDAETARWIAWKQANDAVLTAVAHEIRAAAALSVADFSVLSRVVENGGGRMLQQDLGDMLDWRRPRLSRQLSRMVERGLLHREPTPGRGLLVVASNEGRRALATARPAHARAVRHALLERAPAAGSAIFWPIIQAIADTPAGDAGNSPRIGETGPGTSPAPDGDRGRGRTGR